MLSKNIFSKSLYRNFYKKDIKRNVSANIASYPKRLSSLQKCLLNLLNIETITIIRVYLNEYQEVPEILPKDRKIQYKLGPNIKDSGKFFWATDYKDEIYFSLDDDLIYSESFFIQHILLIEKYEGRVFLTTHGKVMKEHPRNFTDFTKSFKCLRTVDNNSFVNNPGTGVLAFDNYKFTIPIESFLYHGMADLCVGVYCQLNKIPILCRAHSSKELTYLPQEETLFDNRIELEKEHTILLKKIDRWQIYKA